MADDADDNPKQPQKQPRKRPRKKALPRGPDAAARAWHPPGQRKNTPPAEVPEAVKHDPRQIALSDDWPERRDGLTP
jgi:hypothetical protein